MKPPRKKNTSFILTNTRPKRTLSQNFLTNERVATKIASSVAFAHNTVLEIGPGRGILTRALLARGARVVAIEKDDELVVSLAKVFSEDIARGALTLVHGDALSYTAESLALSDRSFSVVANIPYHITGALIRHLLSDARQPHAMALLVQKEVAERVVARDGKESVLSLSVKVYGKPRIAGVVKAGSFYPRPTVDSAILVIENISRSHFKNKRDETRFFKLIRAGFAHKRKKALHNLHHANITLSPENAKRFLGEKRAEDIPLLHWLHLLP